MLLMMLGVVLEMDLEIGVLGLVRVWDWSMAAGGGSNFVGWRRGAGVVVAFVPGSEGTSHLTSLAHSRST